MTNKIKLFSLLILACCTVFISCKDDAPTDDKTDNKNSTLTLKLTGLEDLGDNAAYEGWLIVDGSPFSTGVFDVDNAGTPSSTTFDVLTTDLTNATTFILTIEPKPDADPTPSSIHILAGDFSGNNAALDISHSAALNNSFSTVAGKYILATPTDDDMNNDESGIWFLDNSTGSPAAGLTLPTLPNGWVYEGWAVIDGTPVSTGTFTKLDEADGGAPYSGTNSGPPFPGEDFLTNAPAGLTFPTDIRGGKAVISIEPVPDNSPMPFTLKPLVGDIKAGAATRTVLDMGQNLNFPSGEATR